MRIKFLLLGIFWGSLFQSLLSDIGEQKDAYTWTYSNVVFGLILFGSLIWSGYSIKD